MTSLDNVPQGLTSKEAKNRLDLYGKKELTSEKNETFFMKVLHIVIEPMFLLLLIAATIYFVLGEPRDGAIMLIFVLGIISIDVIQEWKTDKTLNALKDLSAPHITVIRDNAEIEIASSDLVPGDLMLIKEGIKVPADGFVVKESDLAVDESSLTGEAESVWKSSEPDESGDYWKKNYCYAGTLVTQGSGMISVEKTGAETEYGRIGKNIAEAPDEKTPLQKQTNLLVRYAAMIAGVLFVLVCIVTYLDNAALVPKDRVIQSILSGVTLAMAMIPEEFPVILTVFLSMGAWRLAKKQSLVRKLPAVETLGAVTVLCVDKTGTITMNRMTVKDSWSTGSDQELVETMGLACEVETYDPMEKAMLQFCQDHGFSTEHLFGGEMITEYAFTNELKMMGHVWEHDGEIIIAAKGSPESILDLCGLSDTERNIADQKIDEFSRAGLRVIAVGIMKPATKEDIPETICDCKLTLSGLIGLADPPRDGVKQNIEECTKAGIRVIMITGDNGITASSIANQVGIPNSNRIITGDMIDEMSEDELREQVKTASIFSRVIPEHKMRVVKALQSNGEIVAMTGDGVNDAPALKHADIGIAMGKRGSEVSREAADLILLDDNFGTIVETIRDGRRIYDNIKKAVGYVFTIHIPIAFSSLLAPFLGVPAASLLLLPLHVVLLEVIIDPTCSIVLERQPAESDIMERKPHGNDEKLLSGRRLLKSVTQGLAMFIASFGTYYYMLQTTANAELARTMGIAIIMLGNLFLVQVNSSDHDFAIRTIRLLKKDRVMWAINIITIVGMLLLIYTPVGQFLKLAPLSVPQLLLVFLISAVSVLWYELVKLVRYLKHKKK